MQLQVADALYTYMHRWLYNTACFMAFNACIC